MTGARLLRCLAPLVVAGLTGCAGAPKAPGFDDVRREVAARTGRQVEWDRGSADDHAVSARVSSMLAAGLTADGAVQVALLNNPNLQATYEGLGVAQAELVQAGLLRNPVFDADVKFLEGGGGTIVELAVVQDFLDVLFIPARQRVAAAALEAEKLRVTGAVLDLAGEVRRAYYDHAAAEQTLELRRTVAAATDVSYDQARRLRDAGNITALDLVNEQAQHETAKLDLARAEAAVLETRERLNVLMGLWGPDTSWALGERLSDPPGEEVATSDVERRAVESSLELAVVRKQVEAAGRTLGLRRSLGLLPELEVGAAAEREPEGEWGVGPAVSLPIPLFDQGQAKIAAARAELRRARRQYLAAAVEVRSAARAARNRLVAARDRAVYIKQVLLPLRQEITRQSQLQYNAMLVGAFQLFQARQAEVEAGAGYVEALRDYWVARSELQQVESGRTSGVGRAVPSPTGANVAARGRDAGGH
jgi:cobalt-zinc-cadmium efflux system outer membrane protein